MLDAQPLVKPSGGRVSVMVNGAAVVVGEAVTGSPCWPSGLPVTHRRDTEPRANGVSPPPAASNGVLSVRVGGAQSPANHRIASKPAGVVTVNGCHTETSPHSNNNGVMMPTMASEEPVSVVCSPLVECGLANRVRISIACLLQQQNPGQKNYVKEEEGRVVLYTTSMGIIRRTAERCRRVKNILLTLLVRFEERDVYMNRQYQREVMERLGDSDVTVPQVFVDGILLGDAEIVERMNETGELRERLQLFKRTTAPKMCQKCGDFRFLPCPMCGGSKRSAKPILYFTPELSALRCTNCDECGLVKCDMCLLDS